MRARTWNNLKNNTEKEREREIHIWKILHVIHENSIAIVTSFSNIVERKKERK